MPKIIVLAANINIPKYKIEIRLFGFVIFLPEALAKKPPLTSMAASGKPVRTNNSKALFKLE